MRYRSVAYDQTGVTDLVAEETAGDVDLLAPNDDNLLAVENLLRDNRSKTAQKMALAVNDDRGGGERGHGGSAKASGGMWNNANKHENWTEMVALTNLEEGGGRKYGRTASARSRVG